ncbi:MAG: CDGSH iron-sulfur domain-containing protein [Bacteroidetes bacterium]|nr:CDGSH iron-sulfur domain-containing protein [Bacteroidota bacterium]
MPAKITVNDNGSIRVEGEVEVFDRSGNKYGLAGRTVISLCRCGGSNKKPFCDGSHRSIGFSSVCTAYDLEPKK